MSYVDPLKQKEAQNKSYLKYKALVRIRSDAVKLKKKEYLDLLKNVPCMDCGKSFPPYVMEFDHRLGETKNAGIAVLRTTASWDRLLVEVKKCDIICSNCHKIRTYTRFVQRKDTILIS